MSRGGALILFGILIMIVPFSGLPLALRTTLLVVFGFGVCLVGLTLRSQQAARAREVESASNPVI